MTARTNRTLAILLRLRRQQEDRASQEFARAKAAVDAILSEISRLESSQSQQNQVVRTLISEGQATPRRRQAVMAQYRQAASDIRREIARMLAPLEAAREELRRHREEFMER